MTAKLAHRKAICPPAINSILSGMPPDLTFAPPSPEDLQAGTLGRALREHNYRFVGEYPQAEPVRLDARDAQGRLVGGIRAFVMLSWMHTDLLWVADDRRGQGWGAICCAGPKRKAGRWVRAMPSSRPSSGRRGSST